MSFELFANISAAAHVGFFVLESLLFDADVGRKIFGVKAPNDKLSLFAYNQVRNNSNNKGWYNLALAVSSLYFLHVNPNRTVVQSNNAIMLLAAVILATSSRGVMFCSHP